MTTSSQRRSALAVIFSFCICCLGCYRPQRTDARDAELHALAWEYLQTLRNIDLYGYYQLLHPSLRGALDEFPNILLAEFMNNALFDQFYIGLDSAAVSINIPPEVPQPLAGDAIEMEINYSSPSGAAIMWPFHVKQHEGRYFIWDPAYEEKVLRLRSLLPPQFEMPVIMGPVWHEQYYIMALEMARKAKNSEAVRLFESVIESYEKYLSNHIAHEDGIKEGVAIVDGDRVMGPPVPNGLVDAIQRLFSGLAMAEYDMVYDLLGPEFRLAMTPRVMEYTFSSFRGHPLNISLVSVQCLPAVKYPEVCTINYRMGRDGDEGPYAIMIWANVNSTWKCIYIAGE